MNILVIGNTSSWWSTNAQMAKALQANGHTVEVFDFRQIAKECQQDFRLFSRFFEKVTSYLRRIEFLPERVRSLYFNVGYIKKLNARLENEIEVKKYDLLLFCKADLIDYRKIEKYNCYSKTWYYFMDPLIEARRINMFSYARRCIFASSTSGAVILEGKKRGIKIELLGQGIDPDIFNAKTKVVKKYDVVFAGSKTPERIKTIDYLKRGGIDIYCCGVGWSNHPKYMSELSELYRQARIVMNLCREEESFSIRVYQAMASGSCIISDYSPLLKEYFERGRDLDWAKNSDEWLSKIKFYLENDEARELVANAGFAHVQEHFNWRSVMKKMDQIIYNSRERF
jgi:glycosyltransferase involved in cell wall biosynthesis